MAVRTFQSRWGGYQVTEVELACKPEPQDDGTQRQAVMRMRMTDMNDVVTIASWTIWVRPDGTAHHGNGHSYTTLKPKARERYRQATTPTEARKRVNWVYSLDEPWIAND